MLPNPPLSQLINHKYLPEYGWHWFAAHWCRRSCRILVQRQMFGKLCQSCCTEILSIWNQMRLFSDQSDDWECSSMGELDVNRLQFGFPALLMTENNTDQANRPNLAS